jgi:hypothetical protein
VPGLNLLDFLPSSWWGSLTPPVAGAVFLVATWELVFLVLEMLYLEGEYLTLEFELLTLALELLTLALELLTLALESYTLGEESLTLLTDCCLFDTPAVFGLGIVKCGYF